MKFLVEMDNVKSGQPLSKEAARSFIEGTIFPTLAKAGQLIQEGRITAGGAVAGRIAIRFIADVETIEQLDQMISSLPLWPVAETRVTPLVDFTDRRAHVEALLERFTKI